MPVRFALPQSADTVRFRTMVEPQFDISSGGIQEVRILLNSEISLVVLIGASFKKGSKTLKDNVL